MVDSATAPHIGLRESLHAGRVHPREYAPPMAEISVTVQESGAAYVTLVVGEPPEVRDSVALGEHEAADQIPALDGLMLDFDHYGRLVGLRVTDSADSILAPSLIDAAQSSA